MPKETFLGGLINAIVDGISETVDEHTRREESYWDGYYVQHGAQDFRAGRYSPPHDFVDEVFTWSDKDHARKLRENESYEHGYHQARGQADSQRT